MFYNNKRSKIQGCIKFLIKAIGEEYQVVLRGREYYGCGEEYNTEEGKGEAHQL